MSAAEPLSPEMLTGFGSSIEERIVSDLGATLTDQYSELQDIKNLKGDSTGHVKVYAADKLVKAAVLSINVMPGARYFNIHILPETRYMIPRFGFEGMVSTHGSQISMDFYPDMDLVMQIDEFAEISGDMPAIYDEVKASDLEPQTSRLMHMRAFSSPYFMNFPGTTAEQLPRLEDIANRYFDEWVRIYNSARELSADEAAERQKRRIHFADKIIELDPDREMIVQVYGEATTSAIEDALMK
ncbi:MAG: hypothetical protein ACR2QG_08170 [Gammaproteobacteria bacterium]